MSILHKLESNRPLFKKWIQGLFLMSLILLLPDIVNGQTDRYVSDTGTDAPGCTNSASPCLTISYALGQAAAGDDIYVGDGTYNENVNINKSISLIGAGSATTTVQGALSSLGTFTIASGVNDVSISGFQLIGYDSPNPAIEYAALYIQGAHNNITISDNTITADGEAALLTEYNAVVSNLNIVNNVFDGQTFDGPTPAGCNVSYNTQITVWNVPRQLVVIGPGATNVTFIGNTINGKTGGVKDASCSPNDDGQSNTAVTIDAADATITGNTFASEIFGSASLLRTRGTNNDIHDNIFNASKLSGSAYFHYFNNSIFTGGGDPSDIEGLFTLNSYFPSPSYFVSGENIIVQFCAGPLLSTEINDQVSYGYVNDGVSEVFDTTYCGPGVDLTFGTFSTTGGAKIFQSWEADNIATALCNDCVQTPASISNTSETISLTDPSQQGTITLKYIAFIDTNDNDIVDLNECSSDTVIYTYILNPAITNLAITADPDGDVCLGATNIQYEAIVTGGLPVGELTFSWCAYNSEDGTGTCFNGFSPDNNVSNPTRSWSSTSGSKSVGVTVSQPGCPDVLALYSFEVTEDPIAPVLDTSSDANGETICEGEIVWAKITPGSEGAGTCTDELRYSIDNGATWFPYYSEATLLMGSETVIIEGRRVCDGLGCDGTGSEFAELISWDSKPSPTVTIDPTSITICSQTDLQLTAEVTGGSGVIASQTWSGTGESFLDDNSVLTPIFNSSTFDSYDLEIEVLDDNGCSATAEITVLVEDVEVPEIFCPDDITINLPIGECETEVFFEPLVEDNCDGVTFEYVSGSMESGDIFPIGEHTITMQAVDLAGNLSDPCSFTITIIDYINPNLGCKPINYSLDAECHGVLTPTEVLVGWETGGLPDLGCPGSFTIEVAGPNGENLGNNLSGEYIGQTLMYTISHPSGLKCWNSVLVEDKMPPTIECKDTIVHCLTDLSKINMAIASDNCGAVVVLIDEKIEGLNCDDEFVCKVIRTYKAVDNYGNESAPCTSTIWLSRPSNDGITGPDVSVELQCSDTFEKDENGNPHPNVTGVPTFDGRDLWPQSDLDMLFCNALIDYKDNVVVDSPCKKRIMRTWTITEWWCSSAVELLVAVQIIDIVDTTPPVIPQQDDFTVTTKALSCSALVSLPTLNITDNCTNIKKVIMNVTTDGLPNGTISSNGGDIELGVGTHTVTYTALDQCLNLSEMSFEVTVKDNTDPVAICDQFATVSLREDGLTFVTASAIDDGSYDACGDVTLKIRRMDDPCNTGQDTSWFDRLDFCCLDANTSPMISLLVTDKGGNTNMCMVSVVVQDKIAPSITCPDDLIIEDCLFTFDPSEAGANHAFGTVIITDNCPSNVPVQHVLVDNRTQCGIGEVVRTFSILQNGKATQTCTQTITFLNEDPFYINDYDSNDPFDDVIWPKDYIALGQCSFNGLLPEALPDSSAFPIITEDACDMVGMRYEDQIFPFTTNGACYKIIRTWTIIDWCQLDETNSSRTWSYEQEIKVMDNDAPTFINLPTSKIVFETLTCLSRPVTLSAEALDCTPADELKWTYKIYKSGIEILSGNASSITEEFEVGEYRIDFTVGDRCGNLSAASYEFEIITTKSAVAVCKKGLSSTLVLMDTDGDGIGDTPQTMLRPSYFDNKSYHPCGYEFSLSFSADINDTLRTYTCDSLGDRTVQLWLTDQNGNTAYCETFVAIQDNSGLCPGMLVSTISGRTVKENNDAIEDVLVELIGTESDITQTNNDGSFGFGNVRNGINCNIVPGKDGDDINGVSTYDLVLIQRHILGIEPLTSPYKLIAADVNNSKSISASDLSELRKLILGIVPALPNNSSWRFVEATHKFVDPKDPWTGFIPEYSEINNLNSNMDMNFIGIKIGDVNNDAAGSRLDSKEVSSRSMYRVALEDRNIVKGQLLQIPVISESTGIVFGLQAQLQSKGLIIKDIKGNAMKTNATDFVITNDEVKMALVAGNGTHVTKGQVLFVIEVEATQNGKLSEMLNVGTGLNPEIYTNDQQINKFGIQWRNTDLARAELASITPNPWSSHAEISFELPQDGMVTFKVKDYTGKKMINSIDFYNAGHNVINLSRNDIPQSGVYIYEIRTENQILTGKMIIIE